MEKNNRIYKKKGSVQKQTDEELWFSASVADDTHSYDVNSAFERLQRRMKGPTRRSWLQRYRIALCAAAAIALLLFVSTTSYKQAEQNFEQRFAHITVEAPLKSKSKVTLPDGSLVWLNGGSQIVYSQGFGVTERTVTFKGEAFFEIEKNAQLPFKVHTADLTVTVLGTKFNFRNYANDEEVIVNLMEGKVALKNHLKSMVSQYLAPSEQMILNKKTGDLRIVSADADTGKMWMEDILIFHNKLLTDIVHELERNYDVKIRIDNEALKTERFYGKFHIREQNIYEVLDVLSATKKLHYKVNAENIIIVD